MILLIRQRIGTFRTYISKSKVEHAYTMTKYKYSEENMESISMLKNYWSDLGYDKEHRVLIIDECIDYILNHDQETYNLIEIHTI